MEADEKETCGLDNKESAGAPASDGGGIAGRMARRYRAPLIAAAICAAIYLGGTAAIVIDGLFDEPGRADVAVVLGSKVELGGQPSDRLRARLDKAVELFHDNKVDYVIASGGVGKEGFDEAVVMAHYLKGRGVPAERVIVDSNGYDTFMTAANTRAMMEQRGFSGVTVVTQYFHVPRARMALRRMGAEEVYTARADYIEWRDVFSATRETLAYAYYLVRDYEGAGHWVPGGGMEP